jgi:hypothetical protein
VEDGDISIMDGGGITELDPAGDRLLVDISGFADEWLLRKKQSGQKIEVPRERAPAKVISLMDALRRSVDAERGSGAPTPTRGREHRRASKKNASTRQRKRA